MKQQLELPMLTIASKDIATTLNSNTQRTRKSASYDPASPDGSVTVLGIRDSHGCYYRLKSVGPGDGHLYPVQMCLDWCTPRM